MQESEDEEQMRKYSEESLEFSTLLYFLAYNLKKLELWKIPS